MKVFRSRVDCIAIGSHYKKINLLNPDAPSHSFQDLRKNDQKAVFIEPPRRKEEDSSEEGFPHVETVRRQEFVECA